MGKQIKRFVGGIGSEIYCQEIIEIHICYYPRIAAKGRAEQYHRFFHYAMWIRETVNFPVQDDSFPDTPRVVIEFAAFYKIPDKVSNLKPVVVSR